MELQVPGSQATSASATLPAIQPVQWCGIFHEFQNLLIAKPSCFSASELDTIHAILTNILDNLSQRQKSVIETTSTVKKRGIATAKSYGKWQNDGTLRDHKDTRIKVYLLKCPYCERLTRIKNKYVAKMKIVCAAGPNGKQSPYIDTTKSVSTTALSRDKVFINFRTHLRECMKENGVQPDEAHFKFFGKYDPAKFGQKGYRCPPFKDDSTETPFKDSGCHGYLL